MKKLIIAQLLLTCVLTAERVIFYVPELNKDKPKTEYGIDVQGKTVGDLQKALQQKFNTQQKIIIAKKFEGLSDFALPADIFQESEVLSDMMEKWVGMPFSNSNNASMIRIAQGMKISSASMPTIPDGVIQKYISWINNFMLAIKNKNTFNAVSNLIMVEGKLWYHIKDEDYLESMAQQLMPLLGNREKREKINRSKKGKLADDANNDEGKEEDARSYLMGNLEQLKRKLKDLIRPKSVNFNETVIINPYV